MATDYDAPRQKETDDVADESLEQLAGRRNDAATAVLDVDDVIGFLLAGRVVISGHFRPFGIYAGVHTT